MLSQLSKRPGIAVSRNRAASSCSTAPMPAQGINALQEREATVWQLPKTGNIANLKLQNTVVSPPKPSQVTVAVKAVRFAGTIRSLCGAKTSRAYMLQVGVNFADVFTCLGLYQAAPKENVVPGLEVGHLLLFPSWCAYHHCFCCIELIILHMTQCCQFAGVVTEVSDTAVDSLSDQQANMASDSCLHHSCKLVTAC